MKRILAVSMLLCGVILLGGAIRPDRNVGVGGTRGISVGFTDRGGTTKVDTVKVLMTMDKTMWWAGSADSTAYLYNQWRTAGATLCQLGAADGDTTFAYMSPDSSHATEDYWASNPSNNEKYFWFTATNGNDGDTLAKWDQKKADVTPFMIHFNPFAAGIPANATIVSARIYIATMGWYSDTADTITATLMEGSTDNVWYHKRGVNDGYDQNYFRSKGSYFNQVQYSGAHGYGQPTSDAWVPRLSNRQYQWQWGDTYDWTGTGSVSGDGTIRRHKYIDITDCVQGIVNGKTNNGIAITYNKRSQWDRALRMIAFEPRAGLAELNYRPYIAIRYTTKKYDAPFPGGKTWAFVYQMDDGVAAANDSIVDAFLDHGGKYTIYESRPHIGTAGYANPAKMFSWHDQGMEVASHGGNHIINLPYVIEKSDGGYAGSDTTTMSASWDSLKVHLAGAWIDSLAVANSRSDLSDSRRWGKSMAAPGNTWGPWTLFRASEVGFQTFRVGQMGHDGGIATYGAAYTDTARCGVDSRVGRRGRNVTLLPLTIAIESVVGAKTNTTITQAQVQANFKKLVAKVKGQGRGVMSLYAHELKTGPTFAGYAEGIDPEEIRWMLQVVDAQGGAYMTATEYGDWLRACGTAIPTPDAYGQSAPFNYSPSQRVWYKANGIDNRPIRGFR